MLTRDRTHRILGRLFCVSGLALGGLVGAGEAEAQPGSPTLPGVSAHVRTWGVSEGLPQSSVTDLALDEDGFLWGSTYGGLFRFDGRHFRTFQPERNTGNNSLAITSMAPSARGGLWIVSAFGAVTRVVDGVVVEELPIPDRLPPGEFPAVIHEAADGRVWMVGWASARTWDGKAWTVQAEALQRVWPARGIYEDARGNVILSTPLGFRSKAEETLVLPPFDRLARPMPEPRESAAPFQDAEGRLWIGSSKEFIVHADGETHDVPVATGLLLGAFPRYDGSVWIVTYEGIWLARGPGLDRPGTLHSQTLSVAPLEPNPFSGGVEPLSVAMTRDDVLMVGTLGRGLMAITQESVYRVDIRPFLADTRPDTLSPPVHSVLADASEGLWVSRECGQAIRVEGSLLQSFQDPAATLEVTDRFGTCVRSLHLTSDHVLHAGIPAGYLALRPGSLQVDSVPLPIPVGTEPLTLLSLPYPRAFLELGEDTLLIGLTNGSLVKVPRSSPMVAHGVPDPQPSRASFSILQRGYDGIIWAGFEGGLTALNPDGSFGSHGSIELPGDTREIRAILSEEGGGLWIASYGRGLSYRTPDGAVHQVQLADPTISGMVGLEDGSLWLAQNSGITILLPDLLNAIREGRPQPPLIRRISIDEGAREVNNGRPAMTQLSSGLLAVATVEGLLLIDPRTLPPPQGSRPIRIDGVRTASGLVDATSEVLRLPLGERTVEVDLVMAVFRSTDPVRVRYRVAELGLRERVTDWIDLPYGEALRLGGLGAGRKRLEVEAAQPGGGWVRSPSLEIDVPPFMAERSSVQLAIFLLIAGLVVLLIRARLRERAREQRLALQQRVEEERERHLGELALVGRHAVAGELTAALAHEMGQPLAAILQTATAAKRELEAGPIPPAVLKETVDDIVEQIKRARNVLQGLRRFLRAERPQIEALDPADLVRETIELMRREVNRRRATVQLSLPEHSHQILAERVLIQQVLIILLTNALQAGKGLPPARRGIHVRLRPVGDGVRISVQDRGEGIEESLLRVIFEPFQTTKRQGMGMGLPIARRIIGSHRGVIRIRSRKGAGTVVSFWLPCDTGQQDHPPV